MPFAWILKNSGNVDRVWSGALAEVETDSSGKSLVDRQNALKEFIVQSRLRLGRLQDSSVTLNQFKEEMAKSQAELVPLQAPVFGIEGLIAEVNTTRDLLIKNLGEIEFKGDEKLSFACRSDRQQQSRD